MTVCCLFVKKYFHYKALLMVLCHVLPNLETDHKLITVFFTSALIYTGQNIGIT